MFFELMKEFIQDFVDEQVNTAWLELIVYNPIEAFEKTFTKKTNVQWLIVRS